MKKIISVLFLLLSVSATAQNVEVNMLNTFNPDGQRAFGDVFFRGVSYTSYPLSIAAPVAVFSAGVLKKDKALCWKGYQMTLGIGLSMAMSTALKYSINRERPAEVYSFIVPKSAEHSPSFPSGHTTAAFETATSLSLNFPKWYVIVPAYAWAGAMGYSRMYLGLHYPTDVAAGALLGAGSAWLTWKLNQRYQKSRMSSRKLSPPTNLQE